MKRRPELVTEANGHFGMIAVSGSLDQMAMAIAKCSLEERPEMKS
jgi:hypothetical protein